MTPKNASLESFHTASTHCGHRQFWNTCPTAAIRSAKNEAPTEIAYAATAAVRDRAVTSRFDPHNSHSNANVLAESTAGIR